MNNDKKIRPIPLAPLVVALLVGLVFLAIALVFQVKRVNGLESSVSVEATVTSVDDKIKVSYTYDNVELKDITISLMTTPAVGDKVQIYIDQNDYAIAFSDETSVSIILILTIGGSIAVVLSTIGLLVRFRLTRGIDKIVAGGKYIYANVDKVIYETQLTNHDGQHPFIIQCHYEDFKGKVHKDYELPPIYHNPQDYIDANKNKVRLYIKGKNYKKYRVDPVLTDPDNTNLT